MMGHIVPSDMIRSSVSGFRAMQNSIKSLYHTQSFDFYILLQYLCVNLVLVEDARSTEALLKLKHRLSTVKAI